MPSVKPTLTVRIPEDIRKKLEEQANDENRSVSNMLTVLLKDYFDKKENPASENVTKLEDLLSNDEVLILDKIKSLPVKDRKAVLEKLS